MRLSCIDPEEVASDDEELLLLQLLCVSSVPGFLSHLVGPPCSQKQKFKKLGEKEGMNGDLYAVLPDEASLPALLTQNGVASDAGAVHTLEAC